MLTRILLEGEQALFPEYHAQVAGASVYCWLTWKGNSFFEQSSLKVEPGAAAEDPTRPLLQSPHRRRTWQTHQHNPRSELLNRRTGAILAGGQRADQNGEKSPHGCPMDSIWLERSKAQELLKFENASVINPCLM